MSRPRVIWFLALTACGRLQFDAMDDAGGPGDGRNRDGSTIDGPGIDCHINHGSAVFCDGFEQPMSAGNWSYTTVGNGTVDHTTLRSWGGGYALEAHTDGSAAGKAARWGKIFATPFTSGDLYVREYEWLSSSTVIDDQLSIMVTGNGTPPYPSTYMLLKPTQIEISTNSANFGFPIAFPRDRWVCVEMRIHIDPTFGVVSIAFDGTQVMATSITNTAVTGGYTNVDAGVHYATVPESAASLWVDDVVVDTAPIGCN